MIKLNKFVSALFLLFFVILFKSSFSQSLDPNLLSYIDSKGHRVPVKTLYDWQIKRGQIIDSLEALFGKFPGDPNKPPFDSKIPELPPFNTKIKDSLVTRFYTRYNIQFTVAKNENVTAYLYIPTEKEKGKKYPAIIACQPTGDLGKKIVDDQGPHRNRGYGKELAERGYIVIAPDYPSFGDQVNYDFDKDRYESGIMKGIFDNVRCIDFLQARSDVDPELIGIIGHSLGGHTAMFAAAFDTRIKVIVSSSGWTLNKYYNNYDVENTKKFGSRLYGYNQKRYCPLALTKYNLKVENFPFDYDELIAVIAPRPFFSNSPIHDANFNVEGVRIGIANASQVYNFLDADDHLQVRYPVSEHNFPPVIRYKAYDFLDKYLKFHSYN